MAQRRRHVVRAGGAARLASRAATGSPPSITTTMDGSTLAAAEAAPDRGARGPAERAGPLRRCDGHRRRDDAGTQEAARPGRRRMDSDNDTDLVVAEARRTTGSASQRWRQREPSDAPGARRPQRQPERRRHEGGSPGRRSGRSRDRRRVRVPGPELAGTPRRHRQRHAGGRRPAAVADRRRPGRSGARRGASRDHQIDRRGSSCPILFTWNGAKYEFISDASAPRSSGTGWLRANTDAADTDEFIKVDGRKLRPGTAGCR